MYNIYWWFFFLIFERMPDKGCKSVVKNIVQEKWEEILEFIKTEYGISKVSFITWISKLYVKRVEDNECQKQKNESVCCIEENITFSSNSEVFNYYTQISMKVKYFLKKIFVRTTWRAGRVS